MIWSKITIPVSGGVCKEVKYLIHEQADDHTIQPSRSEKLLGGAICEDLKWREHSLSSDQSLVQQLPSCINREKY